MCVCVWAYSNGNANKEAFFLEMQTFMWKIKEKLKYIIGGIQLILNVRFPKRCAKANESFFNSNLLESWCSLGKRTQPGMNVWFEWKREKIDIWLNRKSNAMHKLVKSCVCVCFRVWLVDMVFWKGRPCNISSAGD